MVEVSYESIFAEHKNALKLFAKALKGKLIELDASGFSNFFGFLLFPILCRSSLIESGRQL